MCLISGWLCSFPAKKKSPEWVSYQEQMLSSQAHVKAYSSGVLFVPFLPGRVSELSSVWYGYSKTFRGLVMEETNSDGSVLSKAQPKTTLNPSSDMTWSQGPKVFCMVLYGSFRLALKRCRGLPECVLYGVRWRQGALGPQCHILSSLGWTGPSLLLFKFASAPAGGPLNLTFKSACFRSGF